MAKVIIVIEDIATDAFRKAVMTSFVGEPDFNLSKPEIEKTLTPAQRIGLAAFNHLTDAYPLIDVIKPFNGDSTCIATQEGR